MVTTPTPYRAPISGVIVLQLRFFPSQKRPEVVSRHRSHLKGTRTEKELRL
jgi:hypothetical protein